MRALVVGAGVIGLSSAIRLQEEGFSTEIWTRERPQETVTPAAPTGSRSWLRRRWREPSGESPRH